MDENGRVILDLEGVTKVYGSGEFAVTALKEANFRVLGGEIVAVMGPSGSGKTTLLTIAGALLRPSTGNVTICGIDVTRLNEARLAAIRRERIGFVYQSFNLLEALTALENVRIVLQEGRNHSRASAADRAREILEMFGLSHRINSLPKKMSDGEKQRVAIARALAKDPELILADEPTANLDTPNGKQVMEIMTRLNQETSVTFIFATHDPRVIEYARRVITLRDGLIVENNVNEISAEEKIGLGV